MRYAIVLPVNRCGPKQCLLSRTDIKQASLRKGGSFAYRFEHRRCCIACKVVSRMDLPLWTVLLLCSMRDADRFHFSATLYRLAPELATNAGLLVAAERQVRVERHMAVDPDSTRLNLRDEVHHRTQIVAPQTRGKTIRAVVRKTDRVVGMVERNRHEHRAEYFLAHDRARMIDID